MHTPGPWAVETPMGEQEPVIVEANKERSPDLRRAGNAGCAESCRGRRRSKDSRVRQSQSRNRESYGELMVEFALAVVVALLLLLLVLTAIEV